MGAPEGNQFWKLRAKHGRDTIFSSPEELEKACFEYLEVTSKRTWDEQHWVGKEGDEVVKHHPVPFTIHGLCTFLGIDVRTWNNYRNDDNRKDFFPVIRAIEQIIYTQKFEGASVGFFNQNIIARDLGLKESITLDDNRKSVAKLFPTREEMEDEQKDS